MLSSCTETNCPHFGLRKNGRIPVNPTHIRFQYQKGNQQRVSYPNPSIIPNFVLKPHIYLRRQKAPLHTVLRQERTLAARICRTAHNGAYTVPPGESYKYKSAPGVIAPTKPCAEIPLYGYGISTFNHPAPSHIL